MAARLEQPSEVFVAREKELNVLRSAVDEVRGGRRRVVLVAAQAGIGGTALVDRFLHLEADVQVLRAKGEPWEALVPYGVVDQLMRDGCISRPTIVAAREWTPPVDEPINVGGRVLELLGGLDGKCPAVLAIDDAHWADLDSLRALLFALRRLTNFRVLAVFTLRTEDLGPLPDGPRRLAGGQIGTTPQVAVPARLAAFAEERRA